MSSERFFDSVSDFVTWSGGDHAISKILIANNGIGATKAIRSIRRWSYETFGDERAIKFVVMATPQDMNANAEYIRMADQVVDVPGGTNNNNYANINLICEIAERLKVDAVMPMWGHASENPALPTSLLKLKHKVSFIGPPAAPMHALGDKIGSTIIAQSAGVPTIAWNGDGLKVNYKVDGLPQSIYDMADVKTVEDAYSCAERIGLPVMIKASEGGGGKGIRKVLKLEDVHNLFRQVQAEIPGSPIFVMKMASKARHLEVQLLADKHGDAIALSGRDCSVQRRHQKIIEEGPPIAAPPNIFKKMEMAAVSLAKTVGYCNAGTVEYLYIEETQDFAFLELNPRLQVEHPVTENILGINLPACQLQVAMGIPLYRIGDIRKLYGRHRRGRDTIDFDYAERQAPPRHCIAVRVTAENPEAGFQPSSGKIRELQFRSSVDVWGYFSVDHSGLIHEFADSQFGHIFASGIDRESARRAMIVALKELQIRGDIRTTTEYIIKMMQSSDFIENRINTDWLDGRLLQYKELAVIENRLYCPAPKVVASCGAALQGYQYFQQRNQSFINMLKVGQVPSKESLSSTVSIDLIYNNVKYATKCIQYGPETVVVFCNNASQEINVRSLTDGGYLINLDGINHLVYSQNESDGSMRMFLDGHTCLFTPEYDPTKFISSVAGKIARLLIADGSHINAGESFVEIEVMKMYMPLKALESGVVHFQMSEGASISPGDVIAKIDLDNPDSVTHAEEFKETLSIDKSSLAAADKTEKGDLPHLKLRESIREIEKVFEGYPVPEANIKSSLDQMIACYKNPLLPVLRVEEHLSILRGRLDAEIATNISALNQKYKDAISGSIVIPKYPAVKVLSLLNAHAQTLSIDRRLAFNNLISELWCSIELFVFNMDEIIVSTLVGFLEKFITIEKVFDPLSYTDVVTQIRKENVENLDQVLQICRSHVNLKAKTFLVLQVMNAIRAFSLTNLSKRPDLPAGIMLKTELNTRKLKTRLTDLAKLSHSSYSHVSFAATLVLMDQFSLSIENRRQRMHDAIVAALTTGDPVGYGDRIEELQKFIDSNIVIRDLVIDSLCHDSDYQLAVMELYIRKIYQNNHVVHSMVHGTSLADDGSDRFPWIGFDFVTRNVSAFIPDLSMPSEKALSFSDLVTFSRAQNASNIVATSSQQALEKPRNQVASEMRFGLLTMLESFADLPRLFSHILSKFPNEDKSLPVNAIHIVILSGPAQNDDSIADYLNKFLESKSAELRANFVRRVTFFVGKTGDAAEQSKSRTPSIFTFRHRINYTEDRLFRHVEAPHAFHLDLPRLLNFNIQLEEGYQTPSGNVHLYHAVPKQGKGPSRYFVRIVNFASDAQSADIESLFIEALDHLSLTLGKEEAAAALGRRQGQRTMNGANHFFINIVSPDSVLQPDGYDAPLRRICSKYWYKMSRLAVATVELKLTAKLAKDAEPLFMRLVASNPTGFVLKIDKYFEAEVGGVNIFKSFSKNTLKGSWDGLPVDTPYSTTERFDIQRAEAMSASDTLYVYDWPVLFGQAVEQAWGNDDISIDDVFKCKELVLCDKNTLKPFAKGWSAKDAEVNGVLLPIERDAGLNDVGMVAWHMTLSTPEFPDGRELIVICNDITFQAGSFGTKEDVMFFKASEYSRVRKLPRIFLAANSGARIGMAQSLKAKFQVCWSDERDPAKGFKYIYLTDEVYQQLLAAKGSVEALPVICKRIEENGIVRHVITDIIGEEADLGVENLMGSGLIAGETSRAYSEIFTLTIVVGRTVGIGAYLVRLGQRTIQKTRNAPIILTGYQALNKLMGKEIYTTNDQLGGPMIMAPNGVSHLLADSHLDAICKGIEWLSFVPSSRGSPLPIRPVLDGADSVDRLVQCAPLKGVPYDPRLLLTGQKLTKDESSWRGGFFDRNSFVETLGGWAKTVIVGRGRLGGIPMGVIVTENRTAEATKPADPADLSSSEKLVQQAGGVWFPDSAYKTAQALKDFNSEGLPCIVFANWRGFSGGQRDMFDEVLKFGSMIVDALVAYQQPLFVYIPPFAELRGGAWVVVDSTINPDVMEFYAAEDARGGVLEAAGAASIKFREREIIECAHRTDHILVQLDQKLSKASASATATAETESNNSNASDVDALKREIKLRERAIFGVYQQIAVHFADLHDTPGRMKAKDVIRRQVQWAESRKFFYWRLRRRLLEFAWADSVDRTQRRSTVSQLQSWYLGAKKGSAEAWDDDAAMAVWYEANRQEVDSFISGLSAARRAEGVRDSLQAIIKASKQRDSHSAGDNHLQLALSGLSGEDRTLLLQALQGST